MASTTSASVFLLLVIYLSQLVQCYVPVHERPRVPARQPFRPPTRVETPSSSATRTSSGGVTRNTPPIISRASQFMIPSMLSSVARRVTDLESDNVGLTDKYDVLNAKTTSLASEVRNLVSQVSSMPQNNVASLRSSNQALERRVANLEAQNEQLQSLLLQFEQFFNRLMSDDPSSFDPNAEPDQRLSRLHQYLGNAEAELLDMGIRPPSLQATLDNEPSLDLPDRMPSNVGSGTGPSLGIFSVTDRHPTVSKKGQTRPGPSGVQSASSASGNTAPGRSGVNLSEIEADRLAAALEQLSAQNSELSSRLQTVEQETRLATSVETQGTPRLAGVTITNELIDKVDRLEQVVALQASSILDSTQTFGVTSTGDARKDGTSRLQTTNLGSRPGATVDGAAAVAADDVEVMRQVLHGARSGSSSRKSAFSVARTTPLLGGTTAKQVEFDHVFVNKGRDFVKNNSTFVCQITGYYFITFNLRSYDDRYLGVILMKNSDVTVTAVFTDANSRNVMESQSVIVHLETGDALWLRLGPSERFGLHSDLYKYVTFSGFMIYSGY